VKIDLVSEHASPLATLGGVDAGGQNVHVAALAAALARAGATVTVHTRRDARDLPATVPFGPGVTVHHVDAGPAEPVPKDDLLPFMGEFARDLRAWWRVDRPDVVHSHFWMSGLAAMEAAEPLGIPVLHTYHALGVVKQRHQGPHDTSPAGRIQLERWLALESDRIIATTADEAGELTAMGADPDRITVVPCGVDLARFRPDGADRPGGPLRFRPDPRRCAHRVVVVSRLVERKGIGNVIQALRDVPDTELLIAGGPPEPMIDDDPEVARFRAVANRAGVAGRVTFLGAVQRADVPTLIRSADAVLCCPWYEPFGLVAVEAMACGVPVVVSAVGGLAETVLDGTTGLHVPPRSPSAIAGALRPLLADPARAGRMGRAGVRHSQRFGWDRIAAETLQAYRATVDRRSAPAPGGLLVAAPPNLVTTETHLSET
jgi:glycosyltransferase involved in cell wall biosynthesis